MRKGPSKSKIYRREAHYFEGELEFDRKRDHFIFASFEFTVFFGSFGRVLFGLWVCGKKVNGLFSDSFFSDHFERGEKILFRD